MNSSFWYGMIAGMALCAVIWWLDRRSFVEYLRRKGRPTGRTPVKLGGDMRDFYYIVPEKEYMTLTLRHLRPVREWWRDRPDLDWSTRGEPLRPGS